MQCGKNIPHRGKPTRNVYRERVAQIVRDLMAKHRLSKVAMAERLSCGVDTLDNVDKELTSLNAVTLLIIGYEFGMSELDPVIGMIGGRIEMREDVVDEVCPLAPTLALAAKIAEARAPDSDGGSAITDAEYLAMEADAVAASTALNRFVNRIKRIRGFRLRRVS